MPDTEKAAKAEAEEETTSGRQSPLTLNVPGQQTAPKGAASGNTQGRSSRQTSPARLSTELTLKVRSQMSRFNTIKLIADAKVVDPESTSLGEVKAALSQLEELHKAFLKEHAYFEITWPEAYLDHEYFADNIHEKEAHLVISAKLLLNKVKQRLHHVQPLLIRRSQSTHVCQTLSCRSLMHSKLNDVEKLHYLRGCVQGSAEQLIRGLPLTGESLQPSWDLLTSRFDNKRLIIQAHLDGLLNLSHALPKNAASLTKLVSTVSEIDKALSSLGMAEHMWNCFLVHHVSRFLDRDTREAWETSLGSSQEYPRFAKFETFLNARARALERVEAAPPSSGNSSKVTPSSSKSANKKATANQVSAPTHSQSFSATAHPCDMYNGQHFIVTCSKFRDLTPAQSEDHRNRQETVLQLSGAPQCPLMQIRAELQDMLSQTSYDAACGTVCGCIDPCSTCLITSSLGIRLLIDQGSELTFITEDLVRQLNIQRRHATVSIIGIGARKTTRTKGVVTLTLHSYHSKHTAIIQAHVLKTLTTILPSFTAPQQTWPHIEPLTLADPQFLTPRSIDIIIGADSYGQIIKPNIIKLSPDMPIAQLSIFGWLVLGPVSLSPSQMSTAHHIRVKQYDLDLQELLTRFWVQEELPTDTTDQLTLEEQQCEDHYKATHSRDPTGRYIVRIPLKLPTSVLRNSHSTAHHSLQRILRRLNKDKEYQSLYTKFMSEYEQFKHMVKVGSQPSSDVPPYYLPHHGVLKPDSTTTKLRVVFNGSSPTSSGLSVNDLMHTGANLLLNVSDFLLWIRSYRYIFATDITKMYRQIKVHHSDWDLQRILWIDEHLNETSYHLTTVTYGTKAAPFLAVRTRMQLAEDEGHRFPLAVPSITRGRYVDDIFGGGDTGEQLIEIVHQLEDLCQAGGFPLAKWHSNHPELLNAISLLTASVNSPVSLDDCATKILGLKWLPQEDVFTFSTSSISHQEQLTKRRVLSEVAQIFDPLGFVSPIVIRAKMLLQELWLHKINWDDPLQSQVVSRWLNIRKDLTSLARLSIPRWFNTSSGSTVELHGFSDASQFAMAAVYTWSCTRRPRAPKLLSYAQEQR
ncbi:PREDICTED: uncharacterized protein LOC105556580 [Vollenhovia emeryi]|uniref:uncharacterized protein LOC105556580 n=1 Tax=Vollenhovia emeryi TaxID=411798 RepID=UPI0005F363E3|nr:PREDICTED: uncharacterized protein LOC105556580 [Vollenhovia emeryi]